MKLDKELIGHILKYIEETEVSFDAEFGVNRTFPQILKDEPEIRHFYNQIKEAYDKAE